jgi:hypothetical protein
VIGAVTTWTAIQQIHRDGESIRPEGQRHGGMEQESAKAIVQSAKDAFGAAVLL